MPSCILAFMVAAPAWCADIAAPAPAPGDGDWVIQIGQAVAGKTLVLLLARRNGAWVHAVGRVPGWNLANHTLDVSRLAFAAAGSELAGELGVVLQPDNYVPRNRKPLAGTLTIAAKASATAAAGERTIAGTCSGRIGDENVTVALGGSFRPPGVQTAAVTRIATAVDNAVHTFEDQRAYRRGRMAISIAKDPGASRVQLSCFDPWHWKSATDVESATLLDGELKAVFTATVTGANHVTAGRYRYQVEGRVYAGGYGAGVLRIALDDAPIGDGVWWMQPAAPPNAP